MATKKTAESENYPSTDWHSFRVPPETDENGDKVKGRNENACETCGEPRDALVHQVDEAGNPTQEAQLQAQGLRKA